MKDSQKQLMLRLCSAIGAVLNDNTNENYINLEEEDATEFFYVLGAIVPCMIYGELTGNDTNILDFNHLVNSLIVQNGFTVGLED